MTTTKKDDGMQLKNCTFIFETEEDLRKFWKYVLDGSTNARVDGNHFIVIENTKVRRFIRWIISKI